jgi:threonine dehydratase
VAVSLEDIRSAATALAGHVVRTPLVRSGPLSDTHGADVFLKLETLQRTGSFKDRGALVKLDSLSAEERARGVIAVSAGNHAQGVAFHAERLGIPATILMPEGTPFNKIRRTEAFGATVILHGDTLNAAEPHAHELAAEHGYTFVHPYDDERIIAGQGTVGLEMLEDVPDLDVIIVPIGGGGIISGIATAAKALRPGIEIIGVETELYPSMYNVLRGIEGKLGGDTLADGIAVKRPGVITREIVARMVDDILIVPELSIEVAVQSMLTEAKLLVEGAGAVPLAALAENRDRFAGRRVGLVACGANVDPRILAAVLMRGMSRAGHLARLRISITDQTGTLGKVAQIIGEAGGNIVETYHNRMFSDVSVKRAELDAVVETRDAKHAERIIERLVEAGFPARRLGEGASAG